MSKIDHSKRSMRDRIGRQGADRINDFGLPGGMSPPRQRPSKASLRSELEAAMAAHLASGRKSETPVPPVIAAARWLLANGAAIAARRRSATVEIGMRFGLTINQADEAIAHAEAEACRPWQAMDAGGGT